MRQVGEVRARRSRDVRRSRVAVCGSVDQHGVVDVPGRLPPRVEDDLLLGVVGVQRGDDALDRVVEQDGLTPTLHAELEAVACRAEERLVLADRLALVVEDRPAAADPARADDRPAFDQRPRLGLDLLLDLAPEAVGVGEADAGSWSARRQRDRATCVSRASVAANTGCRLGRLVRCPLVGEAGRRRAASWRRSSRSRARSRADLGVVERVDRRPASGRPRSRRASHPTVFVGLPITAVPTTMPSASKRPPRGCRWGR